MQLELGAVGKPARRGRTIVRMARSGGQSVEVEEIADAAGMAAEL